MVVLPERARRVGGSGRDILALCDGSRTGLEVADTMSAGNPGEEVADDVHDFLEEMAVAGALEFQPEPADR